ncbi:hypothetical protein ACWD11_14255 [Streptomyces sp. NPDC002776]
MTPLTTATVATGHPARRTTALTTTPSPTGRPGGRPRARFAPLTRRPGAAV